MPNNVEEHILRLRDEMSPKLSGLDNKVNALRGSTSKLNSKFAGLGRTVQIASVAAAAGVGVVLSKIIKTGSEFEQLGVSFETMLGSAAAAKQLMSDVTRFAAETPFELSEVATGTKQLLAFNIEQKKLLPTLKALGDVSAGLNVPIERLILNYGQVRAQGKLTGRELRDFATAGIPLIGVLADQFGIAESEVSKLVSTGRVGFNDVEKAFASMTGEGGKFHDLMDKQAKTTAGRWSNLKDVLAEVANKFFLQLQPSLNKIIGTLGKLTAFVSENIDVIINLTKVFGTLIPVMLLVNAIMTANPVSLIIVGVAALISLITIAVTKFEDWGASMLYLMGPIGWLISAIVLLKKHWDSITDAFNSDGILAGFKRIGTVLLDVILLPLQQILGVVGKLTGSNLVGDAAKNIEELRGKLGLITEKTEENKEAKGGVFDFTSGVLGDGAGSSGGVGGGKNKLGSGLATVKAGAPKNINISIEKLVETQEIKTEKLEQSTSMIKDMMSRVFLEMLNDSQLIAR